MTKQKQSGFTLIETLVYLGLFSILMGGSLVCVYGVLETSANTRARSELQEEGDFLIEKFDWALSGASSVVVSPHTISINKYGYGQNPLQFAIAGSNISLQQGSAPAVLLNARSTQVTSSAFTDIPSTNNIPEGAEFSIALSKNSDNGKTMTQTFSLTKYLPQ